jgi:hypothetical protein
MDFEGKPTKAKWPVFAGESFDLWTPDRGRYYATADAKALLAHLQEKRLTSARRAGSVFAGFDPRTLNDPTTLPSRSARIAFRDVTRATDSRTVRAALIPPNVFLVHNAPFLVWPRGNRSDEAFLLGVLSSLPLDWYARRFLETHLTFEVFNSLPIPSVSRAHTLRQRTVDIATSLAAQDDRYAKWSLDLAYAPTRLRQVQHDELVAELDACVALLYGLKREEVEHLFETFHEGWDYATRLSRVVWYFHELEGER